MADTFNNGETGSSIRATLNAAIEEINTNTTALTTKQPLDADLTAIAALTPTNDDLLQRKAGAWTNRTIAQVKADFDFQEKLAVSEIFNDVEVVTVVSPTTITITDEDLNKHLFITNTDETEVEIPASIAAGFPDKGSFYITNSENSTDNVDIVVAGITYEGAVVVYPGQTVKITRITGDEWFMEEGVTRESLAIDNVDNTSDVNKPVSTAQAAADAVVAASVTALDNITEKKIKPIVTSPVGLTVTAIHVDKIIHITNAGPVNLTLTDDVSITQGTSIRVYIDASAGANVTVTTSGAATVQYAGALNSTLAAKTFATFVKMTAGGIWVRYT